MYLLKYRAIAVSCVVLWVTKTIDGTVCVQLMGFAKI